MRLEKYSDCINFCKKSLLLNPQKKENVLLIAQGYLELKDEINCFDTFSRYEESYKDDWKFYNAWAQSLQEFEKYDESIEKFEIAIQKDGSQFVIYDSYIKSLLYLERYERAKEIAQIAIKLNPSDAFSHFNLAKIFLKEKNYNQALNEFKTAITLNASFKEVYEEIAKIYTLQNDIKKAVKYWELVREYSPNNKEALFNLAIIYADKLQDAKKAIRYIRSAWELDKTDKKTIFKYAVILLKANDIYRAKEKFEQITKEDKNYIASQLAIAECFLKLNKASDALYVLQNLKEFDNSIENSQNYLITKLIALFQIFETTPDEQTKESIIEICDKIENEFGENKTTNEIKHKLLKH